MVPSKTTLRKYGLSLDEWQAIFNRQAGLCAVCQLPAKRLCIDHEHVKGWKKLPPDQRKLFVRGLLCWFCNTRYVGRAITLERAKNVVRYLADYYGK